MKPISAFADAVAFAQNKNHLTLFNPEGSGVVLKLHRMLGYNMQISAVTGVACRFNVGLCTGCSGGTLITLKDYDPNRGVVLAPTEARTGATVTGMDVLYGFCINTDEVPAAGGNQNGLTRVDVLTADQPDLDHGTLRPGMGLTLQQVTSTVVGSWAWQVLFSQEPLV